MKNIINLFFVFFFCQLATGQKVIPLYDGMLPYGSEMLTVPEKSQTEVSGQDVIITNVSKPTLTMYAPEKGKANGTAVIICPGGAFRLLSFKKEGVEIAQWFNSRGITAFILKYRLVPEGVDRKNTLKGLAKGNFAPIDSINDPYVPLAVADGREAVRYVRQHAAEFDIKTNRIGMIGFSAGGTLIGSVAQTYGPESRPDFVAPIYSYYPAMLGNAVPNDAPPIFLSFAADDVISNSNTILFEKWRDAHKSVEMHVFPRGGHGYAMRTANQPTDKWMSLFEDWLIYNGFLNLQDFSK